MIFGDNLTQSQDQPSRHLRQLTVNWQTRVWCSNWLRHNCIQVNCLQWLIYTLSLLNEHTSQTKFSILFCLEPLLPCSSSCNWILLSQFLTSVSFFKCSVAAFCLWPHSVHCSARLAMMSVFLCSVCPSPMAPML